MKQLTARAILLLVFITLGAFGLRVANLSRFSLWLDEAAEANFAGRDLDECWLADANVPPLNRIILWFWTRIFGNSEFSLRFPSVIFGTLCVPALFFLGRRLFDNKVAWLAAALLAMRPFAIEFSQEARQYPLLVLLTILATWFLVRHMERPGLLSTAGYAVCAVMGLYTFYLFAFVLLAHVVWYAVLETKTTVKTVTLALAFLLSAIAYLPWLPVLADALGQQDRGWITNLWGQVYNIFQNYGPGISAYDLRGLNLVDFSPATTFNDIWAQVRAVAEWPLKQINLVIDICSLREILTMLGFMVPFVGGCIFAIIRKGTKGALPIIQFFVPLVILAALFSWVPMVTPRYMQFILPAYILLSAVFLVRMWRNPIGIAAIASMAILLGLSLLVYYFSPSCDKEDYRAAVGHVSAESREGDMLLCYPGYIDCAVRYYYRGPCELVPLNTLSPEHGLALPAVPIDNANTEEISGQDSRTIKAAMLSARPGSRIWVVIRGTSSQSEKDRIKELFEACYTSTEQRHFGTGRGVDVYLFYNEAREPSNETIMESASSNTD